MPTPSEKRRIVVTGMGAITPCGIGVQTYWENLLSGQSGISHVSRFNADSFPSRIAGEVKDFTPEAFMDRKEVKRMDRFTHFAMAASKLAIEDGNLDLSSVNKERFGILIASGIGGIEFIEGQHVQLLNNKKISPFTIPALIANIAGGVVAIRLGAKGPNFCLVSACSSGSHAIGEAMNMLQNGDADLMLTGGSDAAITKLGYGGFCAMKAMSTQFNDEPTRASRPFDKLRDGFVMGEGSGLLLLETLDHARARGARIYCELTGYATTCDAYHITAPDPDGKGLMLALQRALSQAQQTPEKVDYINAHGTSTPLNDKVETAVIKTLFKEHAPKLKISSTKSMTGHLLGAAGAIEAMVCAKAIETGWMPPTINYENADLECDLDYIPNEKVQGTVNVAISNSLGFGGHNVALVMESFYDSSTKTDSCPS